MFCVDHGRHTFVVAYTNEQLDNFPFKILDTFFLDKNVANEIYTTSATSLALSLLSCTRNNRGALTVKTAQAFLRRAD